MTADIDLQPPSALMDMHTPAHRYLCTQIPINMDADIRMNMYKNYIKYKQNNNNKTLECEAFTRDLGQAKERIPGVEDTGEEILHLYVNKKLVTTSMITTVQKL